MRILMKRWLFVLMGCGPLLAAGQEAASMRGWRVHLDGGTVLWGTLLPAADSGVVVLMLPEGIPVSIPSRRIRRKVLEEVRWQLLPSGKRILMQGPLWDVGFHVWAGTTAAANGARGEATAGIGLSLARLYRFSSGWQVGGGAQLSLLDHVFLPVFAEAGWGPLPPKNTQWYVRMRAGYGLPIAEFFDGNNGYTYLGGVFLQPALGLRLAQRWRKGLQIEVALMWQYNEGHIDWWWEDSIDRIWYRRGGVAIHWSF